MKSILFSFIFLFLMSIANAQQLEGTILYEQKVNLHRRLTADQEEMKARLPEFSTSKKELIFNRDASLYKEMVDDDAGSGRGGRGFMRIGGGSSEVYADFNTQILTEATSLFNEEYLIEGEFEPLPWVLTGETKTILGRMCQQATYTIAEPLTEVVAWFTPMIPISVGPEKFRGLPGAVLEVDINMGERTFTAFNISDKPIRVKDLKAPKKGKKVTNAEFKEIRDAKMKEMESNPGPMRFMRGG